MHIAIPLEEISNHPPGKVDITLNLGQRDRWPGQAPVFHHDPIARVFPALVLQPFLGPGVIVEETIPVGVPVLVDPSQCRLNVWTQLVEQVGGARPRGVDAKEDEELGRAVHAAVVGRLGHLVEVRHLAYPQLMQNLPGLGVAPIVLDGCLVAREHPQRVFGHRRLECRHLNRGNQAIAAEQRHIPRNAGGEKRLIVLAHGQHVQIHKRAREHLVEQLVVSRDARALAHGALVRPAQLLCSRPDLRAGMELDRAP